LGFEVIEMPDKVTQGVADSVHELVKNENKRRDIANKNFDIASRHFSYREVEKKLIKIFDEMNLEGYGQMLEKDDEKSASIAFT
jgi:hypothetical protein